MAVIFDSKEAVAFVGGTGTKAGTNYAGGVTKAAWGDINDPTLALTDVMGVNGANIGGLIMPETFTVEDNGSGKLRIELVDGGHFSNCIAGLVAYVGFTAVYDTGRYEVLAVDEVDGDWIDIDEAWSSNTTCECGVGGGWNTLKNALDVTDGDTHSMWILSNKDETTLAATIDVDAHSGSASTRIFVKGMNATCTAEAEIELSTDQDLGAGALLEFSVVDYFTFSDIDFNAGGKDSNLGGYGIYSAANSDGQSCAFFRCKFRGAELDGACHPGSYSRFFDCEMSLNGRYGFNSLVSSIQGIYGCKIHDNDNHGMNVRLTHGSIIGNLVYDNGKDGSGNGISYLASCTYTICIGNTIYGNVNGDGIQMNSSDYGCVYYNNTSVGNGTHGFDFHGMDIGDLSFFGFNHAYGNTTHYSVGADATFANFGNSNNQVGDPLFTSVVDGSEDFTPTSGSPLIDNGLGDLDIGAVPSVGGAGGLMFSAGMTGGIND